MKINYQQERNLLRFSNHATDEHKRVSIQPGVTSRLIRNSFNRVDFYETIDRQRFHDRQLFIGVFLMYQIYHLKYFFKLALFQPVVIADQFPFSTGDLHTGFSWHFGSRAQINCARIEIVELMPLSPITRHCILIIILLSMF